MPAWEFKLEITKFLQKEYTKYISIMFENLIKTQIPEISLNPDYLFNIFNLNINSAHTSSFGATILILGLGIYLKSNLKPIPGKFQLIFEEIIGFFYNQTKISFNNDKYAKRYISFIISIFIFLIIQNQFALIPFVQSIVLEEKRVFIPSTSHLSQTLTLALIVVILAHVAAFIKSPWHHFLEIFNLNEILKIKSVSEFPNLILQIFLGTLNVIGEFTKVISLSVRLFGNIFAGEVMVGVIVGISTYTMFLVPIPFMVLSIFSGFIQAFVFSFLALAFVSDTIKK